MLRKRCAPLALLVRRALVFVLASAAPLASQSASYGSLSGVVVDAAGQPLLDAEVRLHDRMSGAVRTVLTARDGAFRFAILSPAEYDVAVEALGFRPVVHTGLSVAPGAAPSIRVVLPRERGVVVRVDTVRAAGARLAPGAWLFARGYADLVGGRRLASDAAGLSSIADERSVEGLPWRFADYSVDGARVGSSGAMGDAGNATSALAVPLRALNSVGVGGTGFDVEVGGSGVGLSALSLQGGGTPSVRGAAFGGTSDIGAAALFGGALQSDTTRAVVGLDYQRSNVAPPAFVLADDAEGLALVTAAQNAHGIDLSALTRATPLSEERASGFGRVDWQMGDRFAVQARIGGTRLTSRELPLASGLASADGYYRDANGAQASIGVLTRLTRSLASEVRLSGDLAEFETAAPSLAPSAFAGRGLRIGGIGDEPVRDERSAIRGSASVHWAAGAHRIKVGGIVASHQFDAQGDAPTAGAFAFGDATDLAASQGAWRGFVSAGGSGNFRMVESAFFLQDAWAVADGFDVSIGLRFDGNSIPVGDIAPNADLSLISGLDNKAVKASRARVAPRIGFRWELGARRDWVIDGGGGIYNDLPDRRDIASALTFDQGVEVRSAFGALGAWPETPDELVAPSRGRAVALLGPDFQGPRSRRMTLGVQRQLGPWTTFLRGTYRMTDFLGRRRDLNLPAQMSGADQYGRPLYGALQQAGALVGAAPGSNRRFGTLDAVTAIEASGFSEFRGVTAGLERVAPTGLSFGIHATYANVTDNLGRATDALAPLPLAGNGREWVEATSDTDAPLRVLGAIEWIPAASSIFRFGAVYRGRSGRPFTPGFRAGVDANGDGVAGNDPAFVDAGLPGMTELLAAHACLRSAAGGLAERNGCRGDWSHRLDLRIAFRVATLASGPLDVVLDAMDVIPTTFGRVDDALYLIDRSGSLTTDPVTGVTTIPLAVNPNFGELIADRSPGILFRVGLRIGR
jgi:Carboxypeptidase regulatory-like domain/TonB dependent receptor